MSISLRVKSCLIDYYYYLFYLFINSGVKCNVDMFLTDFLRFHHYISVILRHLGLQKDKRSFSSSCFVFCSIFYLRKTNPISFPLYLCQSTLTKSSASVVPNCLRWAGFV